MNLVDILKDAGIKLSISFKNDIEKQENQFENQNIIILILLNDDENSLTYIVQSLIDIANFNLKQAQAIALAAHSNGKAIIGYGNNNEINILIEKFKDAGIKVETVSDQITGDWIGG